MDLVRNTHVSNYKEQTNDSFEYRNSYSKIVKKSQYIFKSKNFSGISKQVHSGLLLIHWDVVSSKGKRKQDFKTNE